MGRLRDVKEFEGTPIMAEINSTKVRGDALSDAAYLAKRAAEDLLEQVDGRARGLAGFAVLSGFLSMVCGLVVINGSPLWPIFAVLAGIAILVPTGYALAHAIGLSTKAVNVSFERGYRQALALQAKRLGDAAGATDVHNVPLSPQALINLQLDALYKDLDRSEQRLIAAGGNDRRKKNNRLHEKIVPTQTETFLTGADGRRYAVRIAELTQSVIALKGTIPPVYENEQVQIGARRAKVAKVAKGEAALQLLTPIMPTEFNKRIVL